MKKIISTGMLSLFLATSQFGTVAAMTFSQPATQAAASRSLGQTRMDPPIPDANCTSVPGQPCRPAKP